MTVLALYAKRCPEWRRSRKKIVKCQNEKTLITLYNPDISLDLKFIGKFELSKGLLNFVCEVSIKVL